MSGIATGWVLKNGPRPETCDKHGQPYGQAKARLLRSVLHCIADAANIRGENSHPGRGDISEGSLYSIATVTRAIGHLLDDGWLVVTEEGGGRGRATVYAIPGMKAAHPEPVPVDEDPTETGSEPAHRELVPSGANPETGSDRGKPAHADAVTSTAAAPTVSPTASSPPSPPPGGTVEPFSVQASKLVNAHSVRNPRLAVSHDELVRLVTDTLERGITGEQVHQALRTVSRHTRVGYERALSKLESALVRTAPSPALTDAQRAADERRPDEAEQERARAAMAAAREAMARARAKDPDAA